MQKRETPCKDTPDLIAKPNYPLPLQCFPLMRLASINLIMNKYFYFAVIRFEEVMIAGTERTKRVPVTHFGRNAYDTPQAAYDANRDWVCSHLGERFTVAGFPKKLKLDEHGISLGYVEDEADSMPF